ncbi:hypothetical protein [Flavobacterium cyclinae]|uniref:hypothetical protein n=1 Tax=Flavobacterium cyclinae TaxID=2895947 RepID=UPI001E47CF85|nr:hypothetical protein [Flavobacterium cyclinae]UGS19877.1 hypothetical protein LOS86_07555 [Flavobacterium cyclinae]
MENTIENILNIESFVGEDGNSYVKITKEILTPRKTYLKGTISGKYRGTRLVGYSSYEDLFDFEIYEAEVNCKSKDDVRKNKSFEFPNDFKGINVDSISGNVFPKDKLPSTLPVQMLSDGKSFGINLLEPKLYEFEIIRKLHQTEGDEVFGSFNAYVTGYVFDYESEIVEEIKEQLNNGRDEDKDENNDLITDNKVCESSKVPTGRTNRKGDYISKEYRCKHHNDTVWDDYIYKPEKPITETGGGCFSSIFSILLLIIGLFLLIKFLPGLLYLIGFFIIISLISFLEPVLRWIFRILGPLLLIAFIGSLIYNFSKSGGGRNFSPIPSSTDVPRETTPIVEPLPVVENETDNYNPIDSTQVVQEKNDSIITRYRQWKDYKGNVYEGTYQIKLSDYRKASFFKNNLGLNDQSIKNYDQIIHNLKENDKSKLNGLYRMFDSIQNANQLNKNQFAEMVVTFVQDIRYALVLSDGCDPSLYNDRFTRNYLLNNKGFCDGNQRFGINTPVEFLTNLKGDCDTRTLLLYTILSHYNYDVAVMSSEFYGHSILGINLPYNGLAYNYKNQKYILWETTALGAKPGIISNDISNTNYWRISLKSK